MRKLSPALAVMAAAVACGQEPVGQSVALLHGVPMGTLCRDGQLDGPAIPSAPNPDRCYPSIVRIHVRGFRLQCADLIYRSPYSTELCDGEDREKTVELPASGLSAEQIEIVRAQVARMLPAHFSVEVADDENADVQWPVEAYVLSELVAEGAESPPVYHVYLGGNGRVSGETSIGGTGMQYNPCQRPPVELTQSVVGFVTTQIAFPEADKKPGQTVVHSLRDLISMIVHELGHMIGRLSHPVPPEAAGRREWNGREVQVVGFAPHDIMSGGFDDELCLDGFQPPHVRRMLSYPANPDCPGVDKHPDVFAGMLEELVAEYEWRLAVAKGSCLEVPEQKNRRGPKAPKVSVQCYRERNG